MQFLQDFVKLLIQGSFWMQPEANFVRIALVDFYLLRISAA